MSNRPNGSVRIISGQWRHRLIHFPELLGLRPTQDRIRETLFNWLMGDIRGAVCLDLFAGSGALGFEALSRGAKSVTFIDSAPGVITAIEENAQKLGAENYQALMGVCPTKMPHLTQGPFDIVFLDPPYHKGLVLPTLQWLVEQNYLSEKALVYIEQEEGGEAIEQQEHWQNYKLKKTAHIQYGLYTYGRRELAI